MKKIQLLIVVLLGAAVIGGGSYAFYNLRHPYRSLARSGSQPPAVYVHPIVAEIEKARKLRAEGKLADAQKLLQQQLRLYGRRPEAKDARELLGEINTEMFFSTDVLFGKTEYFVKRGDSLWQIAHKLDSTPKDIMRTNSLASDRIQPGDRLLVPDGDFTLTLDLPNERAVVHHGDGFFKQYPIVTINLKHAIHTPVTTHVRASTFWKDGTQLKNPSVAELVGSTPWLYLAGGGYILYGVSDEEGVAPTSVEVADDKDGVARDPDVPPRGIALMKDDLAELQLLIDRGTPVTIIGSK